MWKTNLKDSNLELMEEHEVVDESRSRGPYDRSIEEDEFPSRNVFDC